MPPDSVRPTRGDVGAGSSLGPYELLAPVAQGGMAVVWAARLRGHKGFQKLIALKTMHKTLTRDERFERMFLAEAEFASRIDHPNVCVIRDLGEERGCLYLAMDWIDGDTLASVEAQYPSGMPIALSSLIAHDVALGLHSAHELESSRGEHLGLVHCDVSPQNILISPDGVVKIVDFGLARATRAAGSALEDHVGGKMSYMSPEQGEGKPLDRRSDVFSLGIVLYRMLTGRHPFEGETALRRFRRMRELDAPIATPSELRFDCPSALSHVVMRALAKSRDDRFQSMKELAYALATSVPEIAEPSTRDELAAFAARSVGDAVRKRRRAIEIAIQIAERRRPATEPASEPEPEPVSLPSTELQEIEETPPALRTTRPVARSLPPETEARSPRRAWLWASAAGCLLVASATFAVRERYQADTAVAASMGKIVAHGRAAIPRASKSEPPMLETASPAPASNAGSNPTPRAYPKSAPPARSASPEWRYDPGF